jgi:clan AA aspartic protease
MNSTVPPITLRQPMGLTFIEATVAGKKGKKATVKFLVDSGAIYSLLPEDVWKSIGLKPKRSMTFTLADGTEIKRDVSECHITLLQADGHTPVILGQPGDDPLLGAFTLDVLGLVLNPFNRTLQPLHGVLA